MVTTNGLRSHFRDQGREDKVSALEHFIAFVNEGEGKDLNPMDLEDDPDVVVIATRGSFFVPADYNCN